MPAEHSADPAHRPPTRWSLVARAHNYGEHFAHLLAEGTDVDGEARLADVLLPRSGRVLDVGSGMGRVSAALRARGHDVVATEPDPALREQSASHFPDLPVLPHEALDLDPDELGRFDLVVAVGNVLVYLGEETERDVLTRLASLLAPQGRIMAGFHLDGERAGSRHYPAREFAEDVMASGLQVLQRFGSYDLDPPSDDYAVWVLGRA